MSEPARAAKTPHRLPRLYRQALLLVVLPLCLGLGVLLYQIHRLIDEQRQGQAERLAEAHRQADAALANRTIQLRQIGTLLAGSREVVEAIAERDNGLLHIWGKRVIAAGLATEVYFIGADGIVVARGHDEFNFGDVYVDPVTTAGEADRAPFAGISALPSGAPAIAARLPVVRFDVRWVGTVLLYRAVTPEFLAGLGVAPDVRLSVAPGPARQAVATEPGGRIAEAFDLRSRGPVGFHLVISKDASADLARLRSLTTTLWVLGAIALVALPAMTLAALYRLLAPLRRLDERLRRFAADGADSEALVRDIEALSRTRNELGAIAATVAEALRALRSAKADLVQSQKLAGLGSMVAGVTHELNAPLGNGLAAATTLRERAGELAREMASGSVRRSALEAFLGDCEEATRILESGLARAGELLQSFKQVATDQASDRRREYDLRLLAADVLLTLRPTLKKLPVEVALEVPEGVRMEGYPGALAQVLTNLVQNAAVHGLDGAARGTIRIGAEPRDGRVAVQVSDDGKGMPAEVAARVFDAYFTTRLGQGGTGLGLYISRRLVVEVLGGTIALQSAPGEGAMFLLDLPRAAPQSR